jgi:hypothetical protein
MDNDRHIKFAIVIGHHYFSLEEQFCIFKISRCLPFLKWLQKYGIKMGRKNSTLYDIIKIDMWVDNEVPTLNNFY